MFHDIRIGIRMLRRSLEVRDGLEESSVPWKPG